MWVVATTDEFDQWFKSLDDEAKVEIIAKVNLLGVMGPRLGRPHADTLKDSKHANLKELRADTSRQVLRIAFALDPNRAAILLLGGNKAGVNQRRFYRDLVAAADALFDRHLKAVREAKKKKEH